ncbi:MAG TPA: hypothetical protein VHX11_03955 [Acidobacteriaceae bacterium]|nr:hypothetical protein [Acidobacteriaceae bacterium]
MSQSETNSPGLSALGNIYLRIGDSGTGFSEDPKWKILVGESNELLTIIRCRSSDAVFEKAALALARVIFASNHFGERAAIQASSIFQSKIARAGMKRKTDERWKIIRRAIVQVCRRQKLKLVASRCFAESIQADVIEAVRRLGLTNLCAGTSSRSIERHIGALIKDRRLFNAILEACQLEELS